VTGIRRCGKSTIFELFQEYLMAHGVDLEQIITVNLEEGDFRDIRTSRELYDYVERILIKNKKNYVFLDEVQMVNNFQESADSLYIVAKSVNMRCTSNS